MTWPRFVAEFGGIGRLRPAPGSWGSLAAVLLGVMLHRVGQFPLLALATAGVTWLGFVAVARHTADMANPDRPQIVIDEVAGQWLALCFVSAGFFVMQHGFGMATAMRWLPWPGPVTVFILFRLFDIWKPWVIGQADRRGDAAGVMLDDLWAGLFAGIAALVLAGLSHGVLR